MRYLVTVDRETDEVDFMKIKNFGGRIIYKSVLIPLIIVESIDINVLKSLKFVKDIEDDYYGELEQALSVQVRPTINFSSLKPLVEYSGIRVAVIDSGIDPNIGLNIIKVSDYTGTTKNPEKHGSKVASIINSVAPGIQLLSAKITNDTRVAASDAIKALEWAFIEGANVINMSMGFVKFNDGKRVRCKGECPVCKLVEVLASKNILVVTAAGNDGPVNGTIRCPGNSSYSIAVGSINLNSNLVDYSSRGRIGQSKPDLVTSGYIYIKGQDIYIDGQELQSGTSFSAPVITGIAASIFKIYGNIHRVKDVILNSTKPLGYQYYEEGKGKFDIDKLKEVLNYA